MWNSSRISTVLLAVIAVLLVAVFATNLWTIWSNQQQIAAERERVAFLRSQADSIETLLDLQGDLAFEVFESYEDVAYGPDVDRITEQQLLAAEHQLVALQALALQNRQIAELLLLQYSALPDSDQE